LPISVTYNNGKLPRGFLGRVFAGIVIGLMSLMVRLVMKRVFNVSIKKTRNSIKENSFQPHKSTETQPRPETSQPVEDAEWRPV